jgi:DNA modification methylase
VTEPYFTDGERTLYLGDALEVTEWLAADVLIFDPPYGMEYRSNFHKRDAIEGDHSTDLRDALLALWGDEKAALVFGTWRRPKPPQTRALLVWDKGDNTGMGDLRIPWRSSHEEIYVLGGRDKGFRGKRTRGVIAVDNRANSRERTKLDLPTPKPVALMEILVAKTVGVIADPTAGGGSTLIAAKNLGRKAIGVELNERFAEVAATRLSQEVFPMGDMTRP